MRKTLEIAGIFGVKALYVSSDSPEEIDRVRKSYTQLQIYYLPAQVRRKKRKKKQKEEETKTSLKNCISGMRVDGWMSWRG